MRTDSAAQPSSSRNTLSYFPLAGSIAGSLVGVFTQQLLLACLPLYLNLLLVQIRDRQRYLAIVQNQSKQTQAIATFQTQFQQSSQQLQQQLAGLQSRFDQFQPQAPTGLTRTHLQPVINQIRELQIENKQFKLRDIPQLQQQIDVVQSSLKDRLDSEPPPVVQPSEPQTPAIFIDAANLEYSARDLNLLLDYQKIYRFLTKGMKQPRVFFYTGERPGDARQKKQLDWLTGIGYQLVTKKMVRQPGGTEKANLDVELELDMYRLANTLSRAVLVSGDGDFNQAVQLLKQQGIAVDVISFRSCTSKALIKAANRYIDLEQRTTEICTSGVSPLTVFIPNKLQSAG